MDVSRNEYNWFEKRGASRGENSGRELTDDSAPEGPPEKPIDLSIPLGLVESFARAGGTVSSARGSPL